MKTFSIENLKKEYQRIRWPKPKDNKTEHTKGYLSTFLEVVMILVVFIVFFMLCDLVISVLIKNINITSSSSSFAKPVLLVLGSVAIVLTLLQTDKADSFRNVFNANNSLNLFANTKERGTEKLFPIITGIITFLFILVGFLSLVVGG